MDNFKLLNNNLPRGYVRVRADGGEDNIEQAINNGFEVFTAKSIMIKDRIAHRYYLFDNYNHFAACFPENALHTCDEIIFNWQKQKPKFDIDDYTEDQFDDIYCAIEEYFVMELNVDPEIIVCDSSGYSEEKQRHKNSSHLVISNYVFDNHIDAAAVSKIIYERLQEGSKIAFDCGVNKSIQHFRTPCSSKEGRRKCVPAGYTREDAMITTGRNLPILEIGAIGRNKIKTIKAAKEIDIDIMKVLESASAHLDGWIYKSRIGNLLAFNRTPAAEKYCKFCSRSHTHDNTRRLVITAEGVYLKCIRRADRELILRNETGLDVIINRNYAVKDLAEDLTFNIADIYSEPEIKKFDTHKTLYVRANMKMGKTNAAIEYIKNFKCVVVVSFRKTFTADKLAALKHLGFRSYESIEGEIDLNMAPKVLIQLESLHRLKLSRKPDLILLDESESIFEQFRSPTMKYTNICVAVFGWLVTNCAHVLCMDANLCDRTIDLVRRIRGTDDESLIVNNYKNMTGDIINITKSIEDLNEGIITHVRDGKNIIIPTNSRKYAESIYKLIVKIIDPSQVLIITGETSDNEKIRIFSNVRDEWKKHQVVIFTPTCSAGVSFTEKHFDALFGYFTNKSTGVESWRQSMYRARDIASRQYNICINAPAEHCEITSIESMRSYLKNVTHTTLAEREHFNYEIDADGRYKFNENLLFHIWAWDRFIQNKSLCRPIETFVEQCKLTGATMKIMNKAIKFVQLRKDYMEVLKEIKAKEYENIISANEIDEMEFRNLAAKPTKTTDEKHKINKFILRSTYRWKGAIDIKFMEKYASTYIIKAYRNLVEIQQSDSLRVSLEHIRINCDKDAEITSSKYIRHKIATDFLITCGFDGITCNKVISRDTLLTNITAKRKVIEEQIKTICLSFNDKRLLVNWEFKPVLEFINGILDTMYGLKICAISNKRTNRDKFIIKHSLIGMIFDKQASDVQPYIEPNWRYNREPVGGFLDI